jgi:threonine synthase
MFNDFAFRDAVGLAGVNSINWARVLAQVVYYFTAAVSLGAPHRTVSFTVPTGNFGDIYAGSIARRMGLPIEKLSSPPTRTTSCTAPSSPAPTARKACAPRSARRWTSRCPRTSNARSSTPTGATAARWRSSWRN